MGMILASDPLSTLGQVSAIVLLLFMLVNILVGLALALALLMGMSWVRGKVELIKRLRPVVNSVNVTSEAAIKGEVPAPIASQDTPEKVARAVAQVPRYTYTVEQKVEQGSDRVAGAVIEFRARTMMVKGMLKAFFLPGLQEQQPAKLPVWQDTSQELADGHRVDLTPITETHVVEGSSAAEGGTPEPVVAGEAPRP